MLAIVDRLYVGFAGYPRPADLWVCEQCGPEWSAQDIRRAPLRSLSLLQLEALHVMSLDDNDFRYFFPRLVELLLSQDSPVFGFDLARLRGRTPTWPPAESALVRQLVEDLWHALLGAYPAPLGYFSDAPTLIDFTHWCDQPVRPFLDHWQSVETATAAQHLADLVDYVYTIGGPAEPALKSEVRDWLGQPAIAERLIAAGCAGAHELWTVCNPS